MDLKYIDIYNNQKTKNSLERVESSVSSRNYLDENIQLDYQRDIQQRNLGGTLFTTAPTLKQVFESIKNYGNNKINEYEKIMEPTVNNILEQFKYRLDIGGVSNFEDNLGWKIWEGTDLFRGNIYWKPLFDENSQNNKHENFGNINNIRLKNNQIIGLRFNHINQNLVPRIPLISDISEIIFSGEPEPEPEPEPIKNTDTREPLLDNNIDVIAYPENSVDEEKQIIQRNLNIEISNISFSKIKDIESNITNYNWEYIKSYELYGEIDNFDNIIGEPIIINWNNTSDSNYIHKKLISLDKNKKYKIKVNAWCRDKN